ncbi:hypothetical protein COY16_03600 [Candidatus Roizmanbacteria bacterium CG_4_10_14_0_2_um_filter_39_13]|uniref:Uncharacterized protein n=1 Tax=Candidatus Roizmanbacteria bacterium CG_4_10_14_0_2_um_filter_39_13 TaxID=1974825 RepID=A0A2M7TY03_9BACT|nr:MAG: hypothetical protein COY16_03600 [Candidatus Roizmanbacteria bacterium CG_4_10_14_0_2_um_filter_39_13]
MNKQKIVALSALTLAVLGGATVGLGKFGPSLVHAQTPTTQVQQVAVEKSEAVETQGKEGVEANEKNLPDGGHQDADGATVDHQFEGVE